MKCGSLWVQLFRFKKYMIKFNHIAFLIILTGIGTSSCGEASQEVLEAEEYEGPIMELQNIVFHYSDSALVKVKGTSKLRFEFTNGDQEYPEGLFLEFYDDSGQLESTIDANKAFYNKKEDWWRGREGVVVKNMESGKQLNTEELYWVPGEELIHTEKFVTIRSEDEVLYGTGLEAKQDFSSYSIKNVKGDFQLKEGGQQ